MKCNETIGQRIGKLRANSSLTQAELANKLSVKRETVAQWEADAREIKASYIIKLAELFNVSADYILAISDIEEHDIQLKEVSRYFGVSEKVVEGIDRNIQALQSIDDGNERYPLYEIFELFISQQYTPFFELMLFIFSLLMTKDRKRFMNTDIFKKLMPYENWYFEGTRDEKYIEYLMSDWAKGYCCDIANQVKGFINDDEINRLNQLNIGSLDELKEQLNFDKPMMNSAIGKFIDEAIQRKVELDSYNKE